MMGLGLGAHFGIGIGDGEQFDAFAGLAQAFVFGGMMMAENAGADHGSFQRSIFRHAAAEKQGVEVPNGYLPLIRDRGRAARQQTNIAACYAD